MKRGMINNHPPLDRARPMAPEGANSVAHGAGLKESDSEATFI